MISFGKTDNIIFARNISLDELYDNKFVQLETEQKIDVGQIEPHEIRIVSKIGSTVLPAVSVTFVDGLGRLSNLQKLDPSSVFILKIGETPTNPVEIKLKIASIEQLSSVGVAERVSFRVNFTLYNWFEFNAVVKSKGWSNKNLTAVVGDISKDSGFKKSKITKSIKPIESVVQPYITNRDMLLWLQKSYSSGLFDEHCEVFSTLTGVLHFISMSELYQEQSLKIKSGKLPVFYFGGDDYSSENIKKKKQQNDGRPDRFYQFEAIEDYARVVRNSGGGNVASVFDFETGKFENKETHFDDLKVKMVSNGSALRKMHNEPTGVVSIQKSDEDALGVGVTQSLSKINRFSIRTRMDTKTDVGDVVELVVPLNPEQNDQPFSALNSGVYMIYGVEHLIDLKNNVVNSKLTLGRYGYDDKSIKDQVKSK